MTSVRASLGRFKPRRLAFKRGALIGSLATGVASQLVLVVSGVIVARGLGPEDRGYFALIILVPLIVAQLGTLGLPLATTYFVASDPGRAAPIMRSLTPVMVGQVVVMVAAHTIVLALLLMDEPEHVKVAGAISLAVIPGMIAQEYGLAFLQGLQRFAAFNVLRLLPPTLYAFGVLAVFAAGIDDIVSVTLVWVAASLMIGVTTLIVALRGVSLESPTAEPPSLRETLKFGLKSILSHASPIETFRLDQAVIGLFLTPAALGLYVVSISFTNLPRFLAQSIGMIAYPKIASLRGHRSAHRLMWRYTTLAVAASAVVVVPLEAGIGPLIRFFFGDDFAAAAPTARILLVGSVFLAARRTLTDGARGAGHPGLGTVAEVASWISFLPALALLLPRGVSGVALALTLSWAFSFVVLVVATAVARQKPLQPLQPHIAGRPAESVQPL